MIAAGILLLAVAVLLVACFLLVAAHFCWLGLTLDTRVGLVQVLTLCVDIVILGLLQYYLVSTLGDRRVEKNLLITNAQNAVATLKSCRDSIEIIANEKAITGRNMRLILGQLRRLSNDLEALQAALAMSHFRRLGKQAFAIRAEYMKYKEAATGGKFPSEPYTRASISKQNLAYRRLYSALHSLIFDINRRR